MTAETWSSVEAFESQVRQTTHNEKRCELGVVENLLKCYLAGFRALKELKFGEISNLELAWLLLVVRSFNSLRCAYELLQKGYYNQAIMLIRSVEEDYLTCRDCEVNKKTIDALLDGKGELGKGKLTFSEMAKRISPEFYKNWKLNYGQLSEIAHPRQLAMGMIAKKEDNRLNLGGDYNENHFIATCQALLRSGVGMTEFIIKLLGDKAIQWQKDSYPACNDATGYVEKISEKYGGNN